MLLLLPLSALAKVRFSFQNEASFLRGECPHSPVHETTLCQNGDCLTQTLHQRSIDLLDQGVDLSGKYFCYKDLAYDYLVSLEFSYTPAGLADMVVIVSSLNQIATLPEDKAVLWLAGEMTLRVADQELELGPVQALDYPGLQLPYQAYNLVLDTLSSEGQLCTVQPGYLQCPDQQRIYDTFLHLGTVLLPLSLFLSGGRLFLREGGVLGLGSLIFSHYDLALDFRTDSLGLAIKAGSPLADEAQSHRSRKGMRLLGRLIVEVGVPLLAVSLACVATWVYVRRRKAEAWQRLSELEG